MALALASATVSPPPKPFVLRFTPSAHAGRRVAAVLVQTNFKFAGSGGSVVSQLIILVLPRKREIRTARLSAALSPAAEARNIFLRRLTLFRCLLCWWLLPEGSASAGRV